MAEFRSGQYGNLICVGILNSADILQRDAYYHPVIDNSEEPFKWGLPDLDALRMYVLSICLIRCNID